MTDVTPLDVLKRVENSPELTTKEREKLLAIALYHMENMIWAELLVLWEQSQMIVRANGYELPDFNMEFVKDVNGNPAKYKHYK